MPATYDLNSPIGQIRLNTFGDDTDKPIFSDEELAVFYAQEQSRIKLTCARVYTVVAAREALIQKVQTNLGLTTDGAKLSAEFRALAKQLREEDAADQDTSTEDDTGFEIAEWVVDDNTLRGRIINERYRL